MKNVKKIISLAAALMVTASVFVGCGNSNKAEGKGTINVFNVGDYIDPSLVDKFQKETGYKVNYSTYDTNEIMYQKVKTNPGTYDLVVPSDYMIEKMVKEDLAEKIDFNNVPNYKNIGDDYKNLSYDPKNEYSVPYMWGTVGIIYDPAKVKGTVDSWNVLWDPQYKNEVYMFDSLRDSMAIGLIKAGADINTTNSADIEKAKQELLKQRDLTNPIYIGDEVKQNMISGEKALATVWSGDAAYIMNENPNLKYVVPKEGSNRWIDGLLIPKGAPNKEGAEAFINFLCDPENAKTNVDYIGYSTPNTEAFNKLDDETKNDETAYPSHEILDRCKLFNNLDDATLKLYDTAFTEVKSK